MSTFWQCYQKSSVDDVSHYVSMWERFEDSNKDRDLTNCSSKNNVLTLSRLQTHFDAISAGDFWKHCGQRWNCSWWAISPFAIMSLTLFTIFYGDFSGFCHYVYKVVSYRFVVCGEGLRVCLHTKHFMRLILWAHLKKNFNNLKIKSLVTQFKLLYVINKICSFSKTF